ncbi:uncharacterized protein LOC122069673 [Macadamia integrifolia]|uniref:uncharacterized protein LOC122069673 n=1 Tax=Macadamia integrifolia TaxID=60698 RepID=UPI001C4FFA7E|nr:uncharacterized protein LOC122069673 [Macadamia integrifolia]
MADFDDPKEGKNVHWSPAMDRCLIETLLQQVQEGNRCPNGFKPAAYTAAVNALNQQFSSRLMRQHIINRLKTLKTTHRKVIELIGRSGIGWNDQAKMLDVSEEQWKDFILRNPDMDKRLNKKRFELFDEMCEVFGSDHATGEWARSRRRSRGTSEERVLVDDLNSPPNTDLFGEGDYMMEDVPSNGRGSQPTLNHTGNSQSNNGGASSTSTSSDRPTNEKKRKRVGSVFVQEIRNMGQDVREMAQALKCAALAFQQTAANTVVDPSVVLASIQQVEGLSKEEITMAFDYLSENEKKAKAFLALPPRMRL